MVRGRGLSLILRARGSLVGDPLDTDGGSANIEETASGAAPAGQSRLSAFAVAGWLRVLIAVLAALSMVIGNLGALAGITTEELGEAELTSRIDTEVGQLVDCFSESLP